MRGGEGGILTVVNLLQRYLSIVWQGLLGLCAEHERLWLLRRHCCCRVLRVHHGDRPRSVDWGEKDSGRGVEGRVRPDEDLAILSKGSWTKSGS